MAVCKVKHNRGEELNAENLRAALGSRRGRGVRAATGSMVVGSGQFDCGRLFLFLINVVPPCRRISAK